MTVLRRITGQAREPALLIGRLLLAWIFLHEGLTLAAGLDGAVAALGRLGVPAALAVTTIALQVMAGAALGIGLGTRIAAVALGLFCVGTATLFHANFAVRNESCTSRRIWRLLAGCSFWPHPAPELGPRITLLRSGCRVGARDVL